MNAFDIREAWHLGSDGKPDYLEIAVTIPLHTVSEANKREHWATKAKRAREQRQLAWWATGAVLAEYRKALANSTVPSIRIRLDRIAPRELDDDNLRPALKAIRDGITDALGLANDRDARLRWEYGQLKGDKKQYAVRVTTSRSP